MASVGKPKFFVLIIFTLCMSSHHGNWISICISKCMNYGCAMTQTSLVMQMKKQTNKQTATESEESLISYAAAADLMSFNR